MIWEWWVAFLVALFCALFVGCVLLYAAWVLYHDDDWWGD